MLKLPARGLTAVTTLILAWIALASAAIAQGAPVYERPEPNDLLGRTTTILSSDQAEGTIEAPRNGVIDQDAFTFLLTSARDVYAMTARGGPTEFVEDTVLDLYAADGVTLIASDDDSGDGNYSRLGPIRLQPGTYHLNVRPGSVDTIPGSYTLDLISLPLSTAPITLCGPSLSPVLEPIEPNAGIFAARPVNHCSRILGSIDTSGTDEDWYRLLTTRTLVISAETTSGCGTLADSGLRIWDSTGTQILHEDRLPGALSRLEARLEPSTYFIAIDGGTTGDSGNYCLELRCALPGNAPFGAPSTTVAGTGCQTTDGGVPRMLPRLGEAARIGSLFSIDCVDLPLAATTAFAIVGFQPLSIDLSVAGAPGCFLLTNTVVVTPRPAAMGQSEFQIPIDSGSGLIGQPFYIQFASADPGVNGLGLVFSNRADGMIGL